MKRIVPLLLPLILILIIINIVRQTFSAINSNHRLDQEIESLAKIQQENSKLTKQLYLVQTPEYIEQIARDKLNMAKPGEVVLLTNSVSDISNYQVIETKNIDFASPNWLRWWKIFF